jgi:hypothetical protein
MEVIWTDYIKYKAKLHGFDLDKIGNILKILVGAILRLVVALLLGDMIISSL